MVEQARSIADVQSIARVVALLCIIVASEDYPH
jgi:hypothetical protein